MKSRPDDSIRALKAGLEDRREEIGEAVIARVFAIEGAREGDPEYTAGLRQAIEAGVDHSLQAATEGDDARSPVPAHLLEQARLAARHRVPLETVLRRYLAGHALIGDFVADQAAREGMSAEILRGVLREQAARTDRVVAVISATYAEEISGARTLSAGQRRAEDIRRLLDGELVDPADLAYDLGGWHIGLVVRGSDRKDAVDEIARRVDARWLITPADEETSWIWLGFRSRPDQRSLAKSLSSVASDGVRAGIGEPAEGRAGWRLTHEQARAALSVAIRQGEKILQYKDVALLASAMQDELLSTSLERLYLQPLEDNREGGRILEATLRAYFDADRSVTSAAAALGISRNTVSNRIRLIEERVGYLHASRAAHLLVALGLRGLASER